MNTKELPVNIALDGLWDFAYRPELGSQNPPAVPEQHEFEAQMPIPACWEDELDRLKPAGFWSSVRFNPDFKPITFPAKIEWFPSSSLPFVVGVGWYRKTFNLCDEDLRGQVTLCVGGVRLEASVWLNGEFLGHHYGHSTAFEMRLPKALLKQTGNELIIAVANTSRERLGCDLRGYKGFAGGITRPVTLKITGETGIRDLYLHPAENNTKVIWQVQLQGSLSSEDLALEWSVTVPGSEKCLKKGTIAVSSELTSWQTDDCGMQCWSDNTPNLYDVEVRLCKGNDVLDSVRRHFGLRTLSRDGIDLRLNGRPVYLRGLTEHCYFPLSCIPPADLTYYRSIVAKLREIGFNWIRCHTWTPPDEYLQAADELGMMVQVEPPLDFEEGEWLDILHACRRHPSVVIYCGGNEELMDEANIARLKNFEALLRQHVPDALFNPQEGLRGIEYVWSEADMGPEAVRTPFFHNPVRLDALREFSDVFGHYSWGYLSYISLKGDAQKLAERMAVYQRPCLAHEIGIQGTYLDLALEQRYKTLRIGTDLFAQTRHCLEQHGLLDKAPLYFKNSCAWQRIVRKHNIETVRKCRTTAGYDFLGATDHHNHNWGYAGGIMNEFYELKPFNTVDDVLKYNGESLLLLDHTNHRNLSPGDRCHFNLLASLFGAEGLSGGTVEWRLSCGTEDYASGRFDVETVKNGFVQTIGEIAFIVPRITEAIKLTLFTKLRGGEYSLENDWDFWVFPETLDGQGCSTLTDSASNIETDVRIVSEIDADVIRYLENGGSVILRGPGPFPTIPAEFRIGLPGRAGGNRATVIHDHPITASFPHEGYCDWQFYSMLENGYGVAFNDLDIPFDPIIELVSSYKLMYTQSSLFEFEVGKGKLLVCTLNLDEADPAARYLSGLILRYVRSNDFKPRSRISGDDLVRIQKSHFESYGIPHTDMAYDPNAQL